jgi:hypothetical protein
MMKMGPEIREGEDPGMSRQAFGKDIERDGQKDQSFLMYWWNGGACVPGLGTLCAEKSSETPGQLGSFCMDEPEGEMEEKGV